VAAAGCVLALVVLGCEQSDQKAKPCRDVAAGDSQLPAGYRTKGRTFAGDVDGDGSEDRVTLQADASRPASCRHVLVVERSGRIATALVRPLAWPGTDPELLLLAEIDGRPGLEPVITLSPLGVYRPGAVFAGGGGNLSRMRLDGADPAELFPLDDEFPAGVDCAGGRGTIVVTQGGLAPGGDRYWQITRTVYRALGSRFRRLGAERFRVEVGAAAARRWPELGGRPFRTCPQRVP
jgi:hypothetical protein